MAYSIIVTTPYFIYTNNHSNYFKAMIEFSELLQQKKSLKTKFEISIKPYSHQPVTMAKRNVA